MIVYKYDHIHLRSQKPLETAKYFAKMFGAKIIESIQTDGQPRIDLDINGLAIFIAEAEHDLPLGPPDPHQGLDHFGFRVENLDLAAADLRSKGVEVVEEPAIVRPGMKIAFIRAPGDVRIELVERS